MTQIDALPIPDALKGYCAARGIRELYPPQAECIEKGVLSGTSMVVAVPTASGKTLVAVMAMHSHIARGGRCLYIVPLRALASEKYHEFIASGIDAGIATGDFDRRDEHLGRYPAVVATSEKVDSLIRNGASWLRDLTLLVVDEIHLLGDEHRGATLEMVITKLRSLCPDIQILALSATIGNPEEIAGWLDAECVTGDWRPVPLREGVFRDGIIDFGDGIREIPRPTRHDDFNLCADTVAEGGQCLVFVGSRRNAEAFARRAASGLSPRDERLSRLAAALEREAETEQGRLLAACAAKGVAFHHAGLSPEQRRLVEEGFREGAIRVIASTPTLAAGLNLPARRVVIRDYLRFESGRGMMPIPVREYHQMAGRAGRPHLDPSGEAVLVARSGDSVEELFEHYILAPPEDVQSRCASEAALSTHILSLIATGFCRDRPGLCDLLGRTFFAYREGTGGLDDLIEPVLASLREMEMITDLNGRLDATGFGSLTSRLLIEPATADLIARGLEGTGDYSDTGLLHLLCTATEMPVLFVRSKEHAGLERWVWENGDRLWLEVPVYEGSAAMDRFMRALKTALLIQDWIDELPGDLICERYGVGPGDIFSVTDTMRWLVHAASRIAGLFRNPHARRIADLELRVTHGVKAELLPLVRLPGIGRVRARRLFNNGITGPEELRRAPPEKIEAIVGRKTGQKIIEAAAEENEEGCQTDLEYFGGS
ncbi:MAG: ATP-dependent DNA helicase [Methanoculleaceae archaeon]